jgi:hypothetical protein
LLLAVRNVDGQRWVRRVVAGVAVAAVAVVLAQAGAAGSARQQPVRAYPLCTAEGTVNGWKWYAGSDGIGRSRDPEILVDGTRYVTPPGVNCDAAALCFLEHPELSGKLATVLGSPSDDRLVGTPGRDLLVGGGGDDALIGRGGADLLCGGAGDDIMRAGRGDDILIGAAGRDRMFGGPGSDAISGGLDRDAVYGQAGPDRIDGGMGDDACFGGGGADIIAGCAVTVGSAVRFGGDRVRDYAVVVEAGLSVTRTEVITEVDRILADERSWIGDGVAGFRRTVAVPDFTILVASPGTVDRLCAPLRTGGYLSCRSGSRVILNVDRWMGATEWWSAGIDAYREYLVNHEVGHVLGHGHASCPGSGKAAPVMMQQTKGVGECVANGWPYPIAAAGEETVEQRRRWLAHGQKRPGRRIGRVPESASFDSRQGGSKEAGRRRT